MEIERREFMKMLMISGLALPLGAFTACSGISDGMTLDEIEALLKEYLAKDSSDSDEEVAGAVTLAITYPAGRSPHVFTSGWIFGARCTSGGDDISDSVKWSGTGTFNPATGRSTRPVFNSEGPNSITVSVDVGGKTIQKTAYVTAVSPAGYAGIGDKAQCPSDAHGCPACPHPVIGPIISGSPNVLANGKPAARMGDRGVHSACCGPNTFEIVGGDPDVLINGRAAARIGSETKHCGGRGHIVG
jgi:uncharacterized Zn-binding protein involved in type VI secretion